MKSLLIVVQLMLCSWWVAALPAESALSPIGTDSQLEAPASELQAPDGSAADLSASDKDAAASESPAEAEEETSEELIMPEVHADEPQPKDDTSEPVVEGEGNGGDAQFVGLPPDAMFSAIQGESGREGEPDEQQPATADEEQLSHEAEELRSAEFVSDIVTAMEDGAAAAAAAAAPAETEE
ncbi:hypothetical protein H4R20_002274 [Coemansia guatemalensis]|uniref:Uncharacterized protein n=1 Tax=Coemansia guatemalensis TaxID=2761395 RepID=A0A9W8HVS0_9FUNG|nr:hypothetical protein H4R20_002274 [Coemansia guatemalensis]